MAKFFDLANLGGSLRGIGSDPFTQITPFAPSSGGTGSSFTPAAPARTSTPRPAFSGQTSGGGGTSFAPRREGVQITEFGRGDFDAALIDWNRVYTDAQQGIPAALELIEQFAPGGSFGEGLRTTAREEIGKGVARDTASAVASGFSSRSSARGLNTLAGSEIAKQFANIDDLRAGLQIQAFSPYTQMLTNLANVGTRRPTPGQFIDRIVTPSGRTSGTTFRSRN